MINKKGPDMSSSLEHSWYPLKVRIAKNFYLIFTGSIPSSSKRGRSSSSEYEGYEFENDGWFWNGDYMGC